MMNIKRISFYGSPGAGKSTMASWLFSKLKEENYNVELVGEYIKSWTYLGRKPKGFDQIHIFGQQLQREHEVLCGGFDFLITDGPLYLACFYGSIVPGFNFSNPLLEITNQFEKTFPGLHIFLRGKNEKFNMIGRFHNEEESKKLDEQIFSFLCKRLPYDIKLHVVNINEKDLIYDIVKYDIVKDNLKCMKK
jgi:Cdc6-like AAA superfamily ATPase